MTRFIYLTKRNMLIYFRDKGAVFFSLLSMLIIIALMLFFLGDMHIDSIVKALANIPGHDTANDNKNAELFMITWTAAGIIPINAANVSLSVLSSIIKDKQTGKYAAIHTSPISRFAITLSYIAAACLSSVVICTVTLAVSELYTAAKGMELFTLSEHLKLFGMIIANSFTYSAIMYLCAVFVKSEGAWSGLGTLVGTLVGFLGGIYLPVGNISESLANILSCTPVIYGTVMFRNIMIRSISDITFADLPAKAVNEIRSDLGIDYSPFGADISLAGCVMVVIGFGILFTVIGAAAAAFKKHNER